MRFRAKLITFFLRIKTIKTVNNKSMKILLADIMYNKNVSARQLATLTGISKSTINNIANETYSPTMDNMERLAAVLRVRISDLYDSPYK